MRFTYSERKMAELFTNSGDPDQMPRSAASDLGLHCFPSTLLQVSRLQLVNWHNFIQTNILCHWHTMILTFKVPIHFFYSRHYSFFFFEISGDILCFKGKIITAPNMPNVKLVITDIRLYTWYHIYLKYSDTLTNNHTFPKILFLFLLNPDVPCFCKRCTLPLLTE